MNNPCPSLSSVQTAFSTALQAALATEVAAGSVVLVPPMEDFAPDLKKIAVITALKTDLIRRVEMGGPGAVGIRSGMYVVTVSAPKGTSQKTHWDVAQTLEDYFSQYSADALPAGEGGAIYCNFPYTINAGKTPDKRLSLAVYVPWRTWASN